MFRRAVPLVLFAFPQKFEVDPEARAAELAHYGYEASWFDLGAPYEKLRQLARRTAIGNIENNLRRARLSLALGDTTGAIEDMDPVLRALPTLGPSLFDRMPQIAALVRALALRAEIADRLSDHKTAAECARAVVALWRDADPALQPVVARMKSLARDSR